jgi:spermidine dehydrogenase
MQLLALEDWNGYGGTGDYRNSNGNTYQVMSDGHQIRDRATDRFPADAIDTGEVFDCVIIGGGISGLAAALFFNRRWGSSRTCLILENHPIFGGEAKRNEFLVEGRRLTAHQGSALFFPPFPGTFLDDLYHSIGVDWKQFSYQRWEGKEHEMPLGKTPYLEEGSNVGFYFGTKFGHAEGLWLTDPWGKKLEGAPLPAASRREWLRIHDVESDPAQDTKNRPRKHGDAASRRLDSITLEQDMMDRYGVSQETIRTFLGGVAGEGSGIGPDALSAYADYAADILFPWDSSQGLQMFPDGNAGVARHLVKRLVPQAISGNPTLGGTFSGRVQFRFLDLPDNPIRIRLRSTVVAVEHEGSPGASRLVNVAYFRDGKTFRLKARSAVMAGGSWTSKHIVRGMPAEHVAAYRQFFRSPCMMVNIAVRNWRFLYKLGVAQCRWFDGIGRYMTVHKQAVLGSNASGINPDLPSILTIKVLYGQPGLPNEVQGNLGRQELFSTPFRVYERRLREQLAEMFYRYGFEPRRDIAGIILNRWGHAYLNPQPGFFFGTQEQPAPGEVLRNAPFGRISFANSDLSGIMDHRASIEEARRAIDQLAFLS